MANVTYDEVLPGQTTLHEYLNNRQVDGPLNDSDPYFTGQQRAWIAAYTRQVADLMLLNQWTFRMLHEPPDDGVYASIRPSVGRYNAVMRVERATFTMDPQVARNTWTHEMLHPILEASCQMIEYDLRQVMSPPDHALFCAMYRRTLEFAVDHLASVLAPFMPMPPWAEASIGEVTRHSNKSAQDQAREAREERAAARSGSIQDRAPRASGTERTRPPRRRE
jgi:hypothetical protein